MPIDYKRYPKNWKTEIVPAVLKRAECKCERCGLYNGQMVWSVKFKMQGEDGKYRQKSIWFQNPSDALREGGGDPYIGLVNSFWINEVKVVLTVAHLDHDEENHDVSIDRLKALCQQCHLRYDAKEKYRRQVEKWSSNADSNTKQIEP
jgi:hypothetical protein